MEYIKFVIKIPLYVIASIGFVAGVICTAGVAGFIAGAKAVEKL